MTDLLAIVDQFPGAFVAIATLLGLLVGSFLNVVILRLPVMMQREWRAQCVDFLASDAHETPSKDAHVSPQPEQTKPRFDIVFPASHCPHCQHAIAAYDNIPVISYLLLRGKCRHCAHPISARYPAIELLSAVLSATVAWKFGFGWAAGAALLFTWALIALTFIDIDHQLLPDSVTLPLVWAGLLLSLSGTFTDVSSSVIGGAAGYLSLWTVYHVFKWITGKEGMGFGDFKLYAAFGTWMGWQSLPMIILLSSLVGAVVGITLIVLRGRDRNIPIPFGPYLAAAGWLALLWGDRIMASYFSTVGLAH